MFQMARLTLLFVLCGFLRLTAGYSTGAPNTACGDMFPAGHGASAETGDAPYSFTVTQTDSSPVSGYAAGQTLRGKSFKFCIIVSIQDFRGILFTI